MNQSFPKASRLLKKSDFQRVYQKGIKLFGNQILMYITKTNSAQSRLGISVPKRFGKSHDRNFFKRQMRENFRKYPHFSSSIDIHVMPSKIIQRSDVVGLKTEFDHLIQKIQSVLIEKNPQ